MRLNRLVLSITCALFLSQSLAFSDVILLQNNRQIQCDSVEEKEKEVHCKVGESTISLAKSRIVRIQKTDPKKETKGASGPSSQPPLEEADRMKRSEKLTAEGSALLKKKQYQAAINSFLEAYDLHRNKKTAMNLAMAYYDSSDLQSAASYFGEVLLMDPEDTLALNLLGFINAQQGDFTSAGNYWRKSYALKPDPAILRNLEILENRSFQGGEKAFYGINREEIDRAVAGYDQDTETQFRIKYDGGTVNPVLLREILGSLDETYDRLRFDLGVDLSTNLEVILYPKKDFLQITGAPDWSGGFNDGRIHLPVGGLDSINSDVMRVIAHELTHSLLDLKTHDRSPAWLQEGLAQYIDGTRISASAEQLLSNLLTENSLPQLQSLGSSFAGANQVQASIKYTSSLSFVQFLIEKHRFDSIPDLLTRIGNGQTIHEACRMAFGSDLSELENAWHQTLSSR